MEVERLEQTEELIPGGCVKCPHCSTIVPEAGGCMWCGKPILAKPASVLNSRGGRSSGESHPTRSPRQSKKTPTMESFENFLNQVRSNQASAGEYYSFLTGKTTELKRDANKSVYKSGFRKWFTRTWIPFFEGQLRPKAEDLKIGEFSEGKLKGVMFFKVRKDETNS